MQHNTFNNSLLRTFRTFFLGFLNLTYQVIFNEHNISNKITITEKVVLPIRSKVMIIYVKYDYCI